MIQAINLALIKIKKEYINKRIYLDCKKKKKVFSGIMDLITKPKNPLNMYI